MPRFFTELVFKLRLYADAVLQECASIQFPCFADCSAPRLWKRKAKNSFAKPRQNQNSFANGNEQQATLPFLVVCGTVVAFGFLGPPASHTTLHVAYDERLRGWVRDDAAVPCGGAWWVRAPGVLHAKRRLRCRDEQLWSRCGAHARDAARVRRVPGTDARVICAPPGPRPSSHGRQRPRRHDGRRSTWRFRYTHLATHGGA